MLYIVFKDKMKQSKLQQFFKKPGPPDETDKRQENPNKPTEELHEVTEVQTGINPDSRANLGSDKNSKNCDQDMISLGEESGSSTESSESEESDSDDECVDERMNVKAKPKKKKTHYKHKFNSDWLSDKDLQKWIRKDEKDSTRFMCLVCNKSYIGGKTHALRHSKNKFHVKNFEAKQHTTDLANLCSSNVEFKKSVMLQKSVENAELKLSGFIAEHNLPFRVMEHLPGLLKNVFPDSVIAGKITCGRDKTRNIIVKKLAPDADQALSEKLQKCKFSILLDESTDKSVVKSMAVVARFWCPQLKRVCNRLLGLVEVPSATAQIMKGEVDKLLSVRNIPKENCIGFGWDNVSVNMGEVTGLKALVKIDNPYVIVVGCVCHSLALCASNASKEIPLEFDEFVRDVYNYIQHSPKRIAAYAEFQGITDTKNHRLLKVCDVRWLSLESVVMRILEQWRALKVYFYEEFKAIKSASAEKVLKMMENVYTKLYLQFLGFILPQVNKLNILFQAEGVRLHCLCNEVSTVFGTILRNFLRPEVVENKPLGTYDPSNREYFLPLERIYVGANVEAEVIEKNIPAPTVHAFKLVCLKFYVKLAKEFYVRFYCNSTFKVLQKMKVIDPVVAASGRDDLVPVLVMFPNLVNRQSLEELSSQWRSIPAESKHLPPQYLKSPEVFWGKLNELKNGLGSSKYAELCTFMFSVMSLPHSSACVERIFSAVSVVKTKSRNRLAVDTIYSLIRTREHIRDHGTCVSWNPQEKKKGSEEQAIVEVEDDQQEEIESLLRDIEDVMIS